MASLTIRNIDDDLKRKLKLRAARKGLSVEEDLRRVLTSLVGEPPSPVRSETEVQAPIEKLRSLSATAEETIPFGDPSAAGETKETVVGPSWQAANLMDGADVAKRVARVMAHARRPNEIIDWKAATDEIYDFLP